MSNGDNVVEVGGGNDGAGSINAINSATAPYTISLNPLTVTGTWSVGSTVKDTTASIVVPLAPTTSPPDPTRYAAVTGSPFTVSAAPFTTVNIPQAALTATSTYYARVKYATTNTTATTSSFSAWSGFAIV
jgi:hypothetical protein